MLSHLKRIKKNKKGFTLIELIVVIAILAVLAVLIVPRIVGFIDSARDSARDSNGRLLYNAAVIAISNEDITAPAAKSTYDAIGELTGLDTYLDEWPDDGSESPLVLQIDTNGDIEVQLSDGTHVAGVTIADS